MDGVAVVWLRGCHDGTDLCSGIRYRLHSARDDRANVIDPLKLQKLPRWAQDVVRSGCFEGTIA